MHEINRSVQNFGPVKLIPKINQWGYYKGCKHEGQIAMDPSPEFCLQFLIYVHMGN